MKKAEQIAENAFSLLSGLLARNPALTEDLARNAGSLLRLELQRSEKAPGSDVLATLSIRITDAGTLMLDTSDEVPDLSLSGRAEDWAALLLDALSSQDPLGTLDVRGDALLAMRLRSAMRHVSDPLTEGVQRWIPPAVSEIAQRASPAVREFFGDLSDLSNLTRRGKAAGTAHSQRDTLDSIARESRQHKQVLGKLQSRVQALQDALTGSAEKKANSQTTPKAASQSRKDSGQTKPSAAQGSTPDKDKKTASRAARIAKKGQP